jgi:class 3 adenylate cyclase/CheY-like chemotaxis protein
MTKEHGHILVVDDNRLNRLKLSRSLEQQGHTVAAAENGQQALDMLQEEAFDLMLLDIVMPEMDGYQVLERMKHDGTLRDLPVIVISAVDEMDSIVTCIKMGAEDYLPKPFDPILLRARIGAGLEKKWWRDQEQAYLQRLKEEQEKSEQLLLNILPAPIASRLKQGGGIIADSFDEVTVLFADLVDFTRLSSDMMPTALVMLLNGVFSAFDQLAEKHGLEKIKTIGDEYMVVSGVPTPRPDHVEAVADMALDMQAAMDQFRIDGDKLLRIRIGIHTGPVVAGVIGQQKFSYDLWGNTVNTASRMTSHGVTDYTQVTQAVYERLASKYVFEERGVIQVKSKGKMNTYFLIGKR